MSSGTTLDDGGTVARTYFELFAMPKPVRITGRSSSITNSFVNGIIPVVTPSESEVREALTTLRMLERISCAYCGDASTEWDHLRPLVEGQRPTGYISEIHNLVPACGKCNQSKGNKYWLTWMRSTARLSPTSRGIVDIEGRIARLQEYESGGVPTKIDFETTVGPVLWERHWVHHRELLRLMREAEADAQEIRLRVRETFRTSRELVTPLHPEAEAVAAHAKIDAARLEEISRSQ